jgi:hypothetical protein
MTKAQKSQCCSSHSNLKTRECEHEEDHITLRVK